MWQYICVNFGRPVMNITKAASITPSMGQRPHQNHGRYCAMPLNNAWTPETCKTICCSGVYQDAASESGSTKPLPPVWQALSSACLFFCVFFFSVVLSALLFLFFRCASAPGACFPCSLFLGAATVLVLQRCQPLSRSQARSYDNLT